MDEVITDRPEAARLAASLSPLAADALITHATVHGGEHLDTVHAALEDGATFDDGALHRYRQAQLARLQSLPSRYPRAASPGTFDLDAQRSPRAELAVRLAGEDLDPEQADHLIAVAGGISPRFQSVIAALRMLQQAHRRDARLSERELDLLQEALETAAADEDTDEDLAYTEGIDELVRAAVTHLLPRRPHTATALEAATSSITLDTLEWLETELPQMGHAATLKAMNSLGTASEFLISMAQSAKKIAAPFELLADLYDTPVTFSPAQAWHLDEAASFIHTVGIQHFAAMTPPAAAQQQPELTRHILCLAQEATGHHGALSGR